MLKIKMKRLSDCCSSVDSSSSSDCPSKRRAVSKKTVEKWILEHDKTLNTSTWLEYEEAGRYHVATLKCKVSTRFVDKIRGSRNFNTAFIEGSANLRMSNFTDHAKSDMHQRAILLLKKETSTDIRDYAPIARSMFTMDRVAVVIKHMKKKKNIK